MDFGIQVSNPKISEEIDLDDNNLGECVETTFLLNTEVALVKWHGVFIPLLYKYTISMMLPDIILMLRMLLDKSNGIHEVTWPASEFNAKWVLSWQGDNLTIVARWNSVIGKTENILNELDTLEVSKSKFVSEWKELLGTVLRGLAECGYDKTNIRDLESLESVYSRIEQTGLLYK